MASYFQNAQKVAFQGDIINAGRYVQIGPMKSPLEILTNNITADAMHNSEERYAAPKCHPDTRVAVQREITRWITHGETDTHPKRVMWLSGPAGTGKTAIAGSIAETCKEQGVLAASFFFSSLSKSPERRSKKRLITTIAYQLLQHDSLHGLGEEILACIEKNPAIFRTRLKDQLEEVILKPLREFRAHVVDTSSWPRVIIIDGLDEVEPDGVQSTGARWAKDEAHLDILSVLMHAASDPAFPFSILIVSRPERAIDEFFTSCNAACGLTRKVFLGDEYGPDADIALFLRSKFSEIRRRYSLPSAWPTEDAIQSLVKTASGQFIYAATAIRYILEPIGLPQAQLERVLQLRTRDDEADPFAALDDLYRRILNSSPDPRLAAKWILAIQFGQDLPALCWRQFLESIPGEAEYLLSSLTSIISIPPAHDSTSPYGFYHKSLFDFLIYRVPDSDPLHVPPYGVDSVGELRDEHFIQVLKNRGPPSHVSEAERDIFLSQLLTRPFSFFFPTFSLHKLHMHSQVHTWRKSPWMCRLGSQDAILSCDVDWWINWLVSKQDQRALQVGCPAHGCWSCISDILAGFFWDVHCQCSWYRCRPACKLWRSTILQVCRKQGWTVPGKWMLLRNWFVRWTVFMDAKDGKKRSFMYPCPRDFLPSLGMGPGAPSEAEDDEDLREDTALSDSRDLRYVGYIRDPSAGEKIHDSVRYNAHHRLRSLHG